MAKIWNYLVGMLFVLILVSFMCTYKVRFTESAVLTTFGKADEGDVKREPGLYFKLPYPIQTVTTYDTRSRVLPVKLETQQTADNRQIVVEAFTTWRVSDPREFFSKFSNAGARAEDHYAEAEKVLRENLRASMALVSQYSMGQLFAPEAGASKIPELEGRVLQAFQAGQAKSSLSLKEYGIEATRVGISRVVLPESVTSAVFESMKTERERLATDREAEGLALAEKIKKDAESDAKRIREFANARAAAIRALGEVESKVYLEQMGTNPELAVYLENLRFIADFNSKQATLVLPSSMPGFSLLMPSALDGLKAGSLPSSGIPEAWTKKGEKKADAGASPVAGANP